MVTSLLRYRTNMLVKVLDREMRADTGGRRFCMMRDGRAGQDQEGKSFSQGFEIHVFVSMYLAILYISICRCVYAYIYTYMYIYVYIPNCMKMRVERERERERGGHSKHKYVSPIPWSPWGCNAEATEVQHTGSRVPVLAFLEGSLAAA